MSTVSDSVATVALPALLNVKQVAAYLGLHRVTVLQFAREGKLPGLKIGRGWRFRADEIRDWLETQRQQSDFPPNIPDRPPLDRHPATSGSGRLLGGGCAAPH